MRTKRSANATYEVGFGKPPKDMQFQKGTSGNPSGKRKKRASMPEVLQEELTSQLRPLRKQLQAFSCQLLAKATASSQNQTQDPSAPVSIADENAMDPPALRMTAIGNRHSAFG